MSNKNLVTYTRQTDTTICIAEAIDKMLGEEELKLEPVIVIMNQILLYNGYRFSLIGGPT